MKELKTHDLTNFINVDKLHLGGIATEYCLYAISSIAKNKDTTWDDSILDILESIASINFEQLNQAQTKDKNSDIIVDVIYEILGTIASKQPQLMQRCKKIDNKLISANPWFAEIHEKRPGDNITKSFSAFRAKMRMTSAAQKLSKQIDR